MNLVRLECFPADGESIQHVYTNRWNLVAVSSVFQAMLEGDGTDWQESGGVIRVEFAKPVVELFLQHIAPFPPRFEHCAVLSTRFEKLCEMAHYYDVPQLEEQLHNFLLEQRLTPVNILQFYRIATLSNYVLLKHECIRCVTRDPVRYLLHYSLQLFPYEHKFENLELLRNEEFHLAWRKLIELTGCQSYVSHLMTFDVPPVETLRVMVPFMMKAVGADHDIR